MVHNKTLHHTLPNTVHCTATHCHSLPLILQNYSAAYRLPLRVAKSCFKQILSRTKPQFCTYIVIIFSFLFCTLSICWVVSHIKDCLKLRMCHMVIFAWAPIEFLVIQIFFVTIPASQTITIFPFLLHPPSPGSLKVRAQDRSCHLGLQSGGSWHCVSG